MTSVRFARVTGVAVLLSLCCHGESAEPAARKFTPPTIGKDTTYISGPLLPDGTVNYVAALDRIRSEGVTRDNNAAVLLIQALGTDSLPEETRGEVLRRLGLESLPRDEMRFDWGDAPSAEAGAALPDFREELSAAAKSLWTRRDRPLLAEWLDENEARLDLAMIASERPRFYRPVVSASDPPTLGDMIYGWQGEAGHLVKALCARSTLRAGEGDTDAAISDLLAAHRLARLLGQYGFLLDQLVSMATSSRACDATESLLLSGRLSRSLTEALIRKLDSLPPLPRVADALDRPERLFWLDGATQMVRAGTAESYRESRAELAREGWPLSPGGNCPDVAFDDDELLRASNEVLDAMVHACRLPSSADCRQAFVVLEREQSEVVSDVHLSDEDYLNRSIEFFRQICLRSVGMPPKLVARRLVAGEVISGLKFGYLELLHRCTLVHLKMVKCALALRVYQNAHGHYPETLADMVPEYLPQSPQDLLADKPLGYRRKEKGFILHSVGMDGIDQTFDVDGPIPDEAGEADDIIIEADD